MAVLLIRTDGSDGGYDDVPLEVDLDEYGFDPHHDADVEWLEGVIEIGLERLFRGGTNDRISKS